MIHSLFHVLIVLFAGACFASFVWSIFGFFLCEGPLAPRMRLVSATGLLSEMAHLAGLVLVPSASTFRLLLAVFLYVSSLTLFWWSLGTAWRGRLAIAFSIAPNGKLLQTGPYRFIRHPIYTAYMLTWLAGPVAISGWWAWLPLGVMGVQYWSAIRMEERQFLAGELAFEYRQYCQRAGWKVLIASGKNKGQR